MAKASGAGQRGWGRGGVCEGSEVGWLRRATGRDPGLGLDSPGGSAQGLRSGLVAEVGGLGQGGWVGCAGRVRARAQRWVGCGGVRLGIGTARYGSRGRVPGTGVGGGDFRGGEVYGDWWGGGESERARCGAAQTLAWLNGRPGTSDGSMGPKRRNASRRVEVLGFETSCSPVSHEASSGGPLSPSRQCIEEK